MMPAATSSLFMILVAWLFMPLSLQLVLFWRHAPGISKRHGRRTAGLYLVAASSQHLALALAACWFIVVGLRLAFSATMMAQMVGTVYAATQVFIIADWVLYRESGYRLELGFLRLAGQSDLFQPRAGWKRLWFGMIATVITGYAVIAWAFAGLATAPIAWLSAVVVVMAGTALWLMRLLPGELVYEWDNRIFVMLVEYARRLFLYRQARPENDGAHPPLPFIRTHNGVGAADTEQSQPVDPAFPLLRTTTGFSGDYVLPVSVPTEDKPHVVLIMLESFRACDIGALGGVHGITPNFDRLVNQGALWENFYGNSTSTSRATVAALYGIPPNIGAVATQAEVDPPALHGLPHLFSRRGYLTGFFQSGHDNWENAWKFFLSHGFSRFVGAETLKQAFADAKDQRWGVFDEYLFRYHADWLATQHAKSVATFSTLLTVTNHDPWDVPANHQEVDVAEPKDSVFWRFLQAMHYSDVCVGRYFDRLRQLGLADNTVVILMADTGQSTLGETNTPVFGQGFSEAGMRIPLLIWAPKYIKGPIRCSEIGSQLDLLPTVMDLFGLRGLQHSTGSSLLRRCPDRQAYLAHTVAPMTFGLRFERFRYAYMLQNGRSTLHEIDPVTHDERDVIREHPGLAAECRDRTKAASAYIESIYQRRAFCPEALATSLVGGSLGLLPLESPGGDCPATRSAITEMIEVLKARTDLSSIEKQILAAFSVVENSGFPDNDKLVFAQLRYRQLRAAADDKLSAREEFVLGRMSQVLEADILRQARALFVK